MRALCLAVLFSCGAQWLALSFKQPAYPHPSNHRGRVRLLSQRASIHRIRMSDNEYDGEGLTPNPNPNANPDEKEQINALLRRVLEDAAKDIKDPEQLEYILSRRWASKEAMAEMDDYADAIKAKLDKSFQELQEAFRQESENSAANADLMYELDVALQRLSKSRKELFQAVLIPSDKLEEKRVNSAGFAKALSPVCVVSGKGPVGKAVAQLLQDMNVEMQALDSDRAEFMEDKLLKSLLLEKRTVILCGDEELRPKTGGFSLFQSKEPPGTLLSSKLIKRILNVFFEDAQMKLALNKPTIPRRAILMSHVGMSQGKTGLLDSMFGSHENSLQAIDAEFILSCKKRGIDYTVVRVGDIVADPDSNMEPSYVGPTVSITPGDVSTGATTVMTAVSALVRCVSTPSTYNATLAVVNTPEALQASWVTSELEWDEELLKLEGPELLRLNFTEAGPVQVEAWIRSWADQWTSGESQSELPTPVEVSKFKNGVRFMFRPPSSSYKSAKEERAAEELEESRRMAMRANPRLNPTGAYKYLEQSGKVEKENRAKVNKKEGGLEIIVESLPTPRVRVRRCSMDEGSIPKDTSEQILIRSLRQGIQILEKQLKQNPFLKT